MLTGWTPLVKSIMTDAVDEVWDSLAAVVPKWKRGGLTSYRKTTKGNKVHSSCWFYLHPQQIQHKANFTFTELKSL